MDHESEVKIPVHVNTALESMPVQKIKDYTSTDKMNEGTVNYKSSTD